MKKSYIVAGGLAACLTIWMASGYLFTDQSKNSKEVKQKQEPALTAVEVQHIKAESVVKYISAYGSLEPKRRLVLRAETTGRVSEIIAAKGHKVKAGEVILKLDKKDREARLKTAAARVEEKEAAYKAGQALIQRGHSTLRRQEELNSQLQSAKAEMKNIQIEIDQTEIRAPFDAILNGRKVEIGDYVAINGEVATIVDTDPLLVRIQVGQHEISQVKIGAIAGIQTLTGKNLTGKISYISSDAEANTRTFLVEIEVANVDNKIPSGISAEAKIHVGKVNAHAISPALLSLDDEGQIGVKVVEQNDIVKFYPVKIIKASFNEIWISGLPDEVRIITVGHGFVRVGQKVHATPKKTNKLNLDPKDVSSLD
ncbi:MAG: efflux RND transporter periplasmic adaptor subunit [Methyloligellaceae bacterium]